jgi:hypothetical protein
VKSILDPTFCYTPSTHTDLSKTFARIRRERSNDARMVTEPGSEGGKYAFSVTRRVARTAR